MSRRKIKKSIARLANLPGGLSLARYFMNKIRYYWLRLRRSNKIAYSSSIMIELTNICNLKCITCAREYEFGEKMNTGLMNFSSFKRIIDEIYPYVDSIGLTGLGETLLYKKLPEAVSYIRSKSKGIIVFISTNAHLPEIEQIISPVVDQIDTIQISVDGVDDIYDSIRKKGDFRFFLDNVRKIARITADTRCDLMFNMVVFRENYSQMKDILNLANEIGIRFVYFNTMNLVSTDWDINAYEFYQTDDFITELAKAKELAGKLGIELETFDFDTPGGFNKCGYPWNHFYITWDGYLVPCCAKPFPLELNFGNVADSSLLECLNSDSFMKFRNRWYENHTPDFCKNCHMVEVRTIR